MSILDDAIREHLELKRAHGADDAELKKLEDEAFGPPARPDEHDPFAEAPTEFLVAPEVGAGEQEDEPGERRAPNIADLQEAPEPMRAPEPVPPAELGDASDLGAPAEEAPALEHEAVPEPGAETADASEASHTTAERHAIGDQPTEIFDVQGQFEDAATEAESLSDDDLLEAEMGEPRLAPVDPLAGIDGGATAEPEITREVEPEPAIEEPTETTDEFDEFFSEQRLSDELNQALEAPLPDEPGAPPTEEGTAIYEVVEEVEVEIDVEVEELAPAEEPELAEDEELEDEDPISEEASVPRAPGHEDVLEDTPDFLEDAPEDDNLWFEQKPPKDIDFGD
jgi:hypothetical protein